MVGFCLGGWAGRVCVCESSDIWDFERIKCGKGWQIKIKFVNTDLYTVYSTIIDDASVATLLSLRIWHSMLLAIFSFPRKWLALTCCSLLLWTGVWTTVIVVLVHVRVHVAHIWINCTMHNCTMKFGMAVRKHSFGQNFHLLIFEQFSCPFHLFRIPIDRVFRCRLQNLGVVLLHCSQCFFVIVHGRFHDCNHFVVRTWLVVSGKLPTVADGFWQGFVNNMLKHQGDGAGETSRTHKLRVAGHGVGNTRARRTNTANRAPNMLINNDHVSVPVCPISILWNFHINSYQSSKTTSLNNRVTVPVKPPEPTNYELQGTGWATRAPVNS